MTKKEKVKINVKERLDDNTLDLSLSELTEVPVKEIVSPPTLLTGLFLFIHFSLHLTKNRHF